MHPSAKDVLRKPAPSGSQAPKSKPKPKRRTSTVERLESVSEIDERDWMSGSPESDFVPTLTLQDGASWGTIYDINGRERVGRGEYVDGRVKVVADANAGPSRVVQKKGQGSKSAGPEKKKIKARKFIGVPQEGWKVRVAEEEDAAGVVPDGVHAFVGSKHAIYAWRRNQTFDADQEQEPEQVQAPDAEQEVPSPPEGEREGADATGSDDTIQTVPKEDFQFLVSKLLTLSQPSLAP